MSTFFIRSISFCMILCLCLAPIHCLLAQQLTASLLEDTEPFHFTHSSTNRLPIDLSSEVDFLDESIQLKVVDSDTKTSVRRLELSDAASVPASFYADTHAAFFCRLERKISKKINGHNIVFRLRGQE